MTQTGHEAMNNPWTPLQRGVMAGAAFVVLAAGVKAAAPLINLALLALLLRLSTEPAYLWLRRRGLNHGITVFITLGTLIIGIAGVVGLLGAGVAGLRGRLPFYEARLVEVFERLVASVAALGLELHVESLSSFVGPTRILAIISQLVGAIGNILSDVFIVLLIVTFVILDQPRIDRWLETRGHRDQVRLRWRALGGDIRTYLSLTGWLGLIAAILNFGLFLVVGVDGASVWAVMSFLLSFVPNIGFLLALAPPTLLALLGKGAGAAIAVAVGMVVINFVLDNVIKPQFMQRGLDLPGSITIISLIVWSWLLGPVGALLGVPLTVVLRRVILEYAAQPDAPSPAEAAGG